MVVGLMGSVVEVGGCVGCLCWDGVIGSVEANDGGGVYPVGGYGGFCGGKMFVGTGGGLLRWFLKILSTWNVKLRKNAWL
ncbi:hypothetical protein Tco_0478866 [Tanacetum coccineum]